MTHPGASAPRTARRRGGRIVAAAGLPLLVIAALARLPFAMNVVGVLTLITVVEGSPWLASIAAAVFTVAVALAAPVVGALADRFGDRPTLVLLSPLHCLAMIALTVAVVHGWGTLALVLLAGLAGGASPQVSPLMRARWPSLLAASPGSLPFAAGYESMQEQLSFTLGPVLVAVLAAGFGPVAPMVVSIAITAVFVTAFALHPSRRPGQREAAGRGAGLGWLTPLLGLHLAATFGIGLVFGLTLGTANSFAELAGRAPTAGLVYAVMSGASAASSLVVPAFVERTSTRARLAVGGGLVAVGMVVFTISGVLAIAIPALLCTGIGVGILLVTVYTEAGEAVAATHLSTMMTLMVGMIALGNAAAVTASTGLALQGPSITLTVSAVVVGLGLIALAPLHRGLARHPLQRKEAS